MTIGCRSVGIPPAVVALPATSAPEIPLRLVSKSNVVGFDVTIDDQRPDYERLYYPGTCEPRRWHDAVSFVPMESFAPSIQDEFRQRTAAAVELISPDTDHAIITLTSFQFALDQREDVRGEYQAKYVNWAAVKEREDDERQARRDAQADERWDDHLENDESTGSLVAGEILMASLTTLFIDLPRSVGREFAAKKRTSAEAQSLPNEITDGKQTGLNCQIHATVMFAGRHGAGVDRIIRIHRHAPLTGDESFQKQTAAFIEAALDEYSTSL